ncbi:hypothetical protein BDW62DRAFT_173376 [Aspergillus aurantiobrunneus]
MPKVTRFTPVPEFPITKTLKTLIPRAKSPASKPHVVSESLCDDILQRLSPFLLRNAPVDIIDLWPGAGIFSSKVNEFLKPRRHVLIEPDLKHYDSVLRPLAESNPSYKLLSTSLATRDWQGLLSKHLPEQGPSSSDSSGFLPRNDTLLVLASPPPPRSMKDHFNGSRWLSAFMEDCMRQTGLHAYGSVRLLATMFSSDIDNVLPRFISGRGRASLLTEQVSRHAFEVACLQDDAKEYYGSGKNWDLVVHGKARVEQRTSEKDVVVPVGRAYPPIEAAPESPVPGRRPTPYTPRCKTLRHEKMLEDFRKFDEADPGSPEYEELRLQSRRAATKLMHENSRFYARAQLASQQNQIDELNKTISRVAAAPQTTLAEMESLVEKMKSLRKSFDEAFSQAHFEITRPLDHLIDDRRATYHTENFDDAILPFDRRPFEPLLIHPRELYPREVYRGIMYFEAESNPPALTRLNRLDDPEKRRIAIDFFTAFSNSLQTNNLINVPSIIELFFPNHSANSMVKAVPSLAKYASKLPKADFDSLPHTVHRHPDWDNITEIPDADPESTPDPTTCYQENLDYDFSGVRCRVLSTETLWDISIEYARSGTNQPMIQINRIMGGSMTAAQSGKFDDKTKKKG